MQATVLVLAGREGGEGLLWSGTGWIWGWVLGSGLFGTAAEHALSRATADRPHPLLLAAAGARNGSVVPKIPALASPPRAWWSPRSVAELGTLHPGRRVGRVRGHAGLAPSANGIFLCAHFCRARAAVRLFPASPRRGGSLPKRARA